jgi:prophage antirepressor-like protein
MELKTLRFENLELNILPIVKDENFWFEIERTCQMLQILNYQGVVDNLEPDEKSTFRVDIGGNVQNVNFVNEFGLYQLILISPLSSTEKTLLKRWITHDIIPSLRKSGVYSTSMVQEREVQLQFLSRKLTEKRDQLCSQYRILRDLKSELRELENQRDEVITNYQPRLPFPEDK